jgi:hypothetical protein
MVITTFINRSENVTSILQPRQEFRESFNFAGDDILKDIIQYHIIPALFNEFCKIQLDYCKNEIKRLFEDKIGSSQLDKKARIQFTQEFLYPIAIYVLQLIEKVNLTQLDYTKLDIKFDDVFDEYPSDATLSYLHKLIQKTQIDDNSEEIFSFKHKSISLKIKDVINTIDSQLKLYLYPLSEIVNKYGCDFLLLSGKPSCLPNIQSLFFAKPPISPNRIIPMSNYRVDSWYPFSTYNGEIGDPKATAVVGALLSTIASQGSLANFSIMESDLKPSSTIAFIGPMDINRQIKNDFLFFDGADVRKFSEPETVFNYRFASPIYFGFRQFNAERWKATPFYFIELSRSNDDARKRFMLNKPYDIKLAFSYSESDLEQSSDFEKESRLSIIEVTNMNGDPVPKPDINLQLKSLWDLGEEGGHWIDTGLFSVVI